MTIKRVKINYISAVPHKQPIERIRILKSEREKLGRAIVQEGEENARRYAIGEMEAKKIVLSKYPRI